MLETCVKHGNATRPKDGPSLETSHNSSVGRGPWQMSCSSGGNPGTCSLAMDQEPVV